MEKQLNRKGFAAILDGIFAYAIAFVCIGVLALLMTNTREANTKTSYTLNVWADDLANVIGENMVNPNDYSQGWLSDTSNAVRDELVKSITAISDHKGLAIMVDIDGTPFIEVGRVDKASDVATAKRLLRKATVTSSVDPASGETTYSCTLQDDTSVLTVKIGI